MRVHRTAAIAGALLFTTALASAAPPGKSGERDRRDPAVREAQAARQEARRGQLPEEDPAQLERNRLRRCDALPSAEHEYCVRRMNGEGTVSGSVQGGGILRELRVQVPAED